MRPARALIDLDALRHNYQLARGLTGARALAVIKADAYGHGAVECAAALQEEADGFAVACIEEALILRESGVEKPILLLEGFFEVAEIALIQHHNLWCVLHANWQVEAVLQVQLQQPLNLWLKLDSGMHRAGLAPADYRIAWQKLVASGKASCLTRMSHFSRADELDCPRSHEQFSTFIQITENLIGETSLHNSAAVLGWPSLRSDWVRPGIMLYGATPFSVPQQQADRLQPVMTLESTIISVRDLPAGEPVGYGGRFISQHPIRVGVVALGYADGYPRHAPDGTLLAVDGNSSRLIGRVSMDMITVDLTGLPNAGLGSRVELWGKQVPASTVAQQADTIAYQLFCNLKRVPRVYL